MLGSHFDLKSEIARIGAKRAAENAPSQAQTSPEFDERLRDFIRSLGVDWEPDSFGSEQLSRIEAHSSRSR